MADRRYQDLDDFADAMRARLDRRAAYQSVRNLAALYDGFLDTLVQDERQRAGSLAPCDRITLPEWVQAGLNYEIDAGLHLASAALRADVDVILQAARRHLHEMTDGRGRHSRWARRYLADHVHFRRFEAVWFWRLPDAGWYYPGQKLTYGWSLNRWDDAPDVFQHVSVHLQRGPAIYRGRPKAIQKSYEIVTKAIAEGAIGRYYPSRFVQVPGAFREAIADQTF